MELVYDSGRGRNQTTRLATRMCVTGPRGEARGRGTRRGRATNTSEPRAACVLTGYVDEAPDHDTRAGRACHEFACLVCVCVCVTGLRVCVLRVYGARHAAGARVCACVCARACVKGLQGCGTRTGHVSETRGRQTSATRDLSFAIRIACVLCAVCVCYGSTGRGMRTGHVCV